MKRLGFLCLFLLLSSASVAEVTTYGEPLALDKALTVDALLDVAPTRIDETVQVEGRITDVCEMAGCWVVLASQDTSKTIRFKVDDGVIVFPPEIKGRHARAEGVLVKIEMDLEQSRDYLVHMAEERGEKLDPESVTEPVSFFQINGVGAVVD